MTADSLANWERDALKVAAGLLIKACGGYDVAEMVAGRSRAVLHGYQDRHAAGFMPIDVLLRLERAVVASGGEPLVTMLMARKHGYVAVRVPTGQGELARDMAALVRQSAEAAARHLEALADGTLSDAERDTIAEAVQRLHGVTTRLLAMLAPGARPALRVVPAA
jgi:hypothetical protein